MTAGLAALPMYDWPELRAATDRLWTALRDALRAAGVAAPDALSRDLGLMQAWTDPRLVLGQTCGLPLVRELAGQVTVIGAADYGVAGCPPGWYRSALVVRADDPRETLAEFRGAGLAVNGFDSQSGWGAILHHAAPLAHDGRFFGGIEVSGAHAASVDLVASGAADSGGDRRGELALRPALPAGGGPAAGAGADRPDPRAAVHRRGRHRGRPPCRCGRRGHRRAGRGNPGGAGDRGLRRADRWGLSADLGADGGGRGAAGAGAIALRAPAARARRRNGRA